MTLKSSARTVARALRRAAKSAAVRSGAVSLFHRWWHRRALTVLMFHRVLPDRLMSDLAADPQYVISIPLLEEFLRFVKKHYNIVDLLDVLASHRGERPLPKRALLLTFDDGWNDNALYAAPVFAAANVPWTLFVASDALAPPKAWWQETLLWALRTKRATYQELWNLVSDGEARSELAAPADATLRLLLRFGALASELRAELLRPLSVAREAELPIADMADLDTIRSLHEAGVRIGVHGASHLPVTALPDPAADIRRACEFLGRSVGADSTSTMSFPHGRYDQSAIAAARTAGIELLFTSNSVLNACPDGLLRGNVLGRLPISTRAIANSSGMLDLERVASQLILRQVA